MNNDVMYWKTEEYHGSVDINLVTYDNGVTILHQLPICLGCVILCRSIGTAYCVSFW